MLDRIQSKNWRIFWAVLCLVVAGWCLVQAAPVLIDISVQYTIYDHTGTSTPLSDGSVVYVFGSVDNVNNGMQAYGSPATNLIANSTMGDDIYLATVRIGQSVDPTTGTFEVSFQYNSDLANFIYIRFFETTNDPVTGLVYYGVSGIQTIPPPQFGIETVVVDPTTNLAVNLRTNFVVIPEPGTANLVVLVVGMAWAMGASMSGRSKRGDAGARGRV